VRATSASATAHDRPKVCEGSVKASTAISSAAHRGPRQPSIQGGPRSKGFGGAAATQCPGGHSAPVIGAQPARSHSSTKAPRPALPRATAAGSAARSFKLRRAPDAGGSAARLPRAARLDGGPRPCLGLRPPEAIPDSPLGSRHFVYAVPAAFQQVLEGRRAPRAGRYKGRRAGLKRWPAAPEDGLHRRGGLSPKEGPVPKGGFVGRRTRDGHQKAGLPLKRDGLRAKLGRIPLRSCKRRPAATS